MTHKEKMTSGELYLPNDESIMEEQLKCLDKLYDFNLTRPTELDKREAMLKEMFAEIGDDCYIEPPLHANWGGKHCHFGKSVYANFNLTLVDDTHIYVGDYTLIGPNVTIRMLWLQRQVIPFCPNCASSSISIIFPCVSARIAGLVQAL